VGRPLGGAVGPLEGRELFVRGTYLQKVHDLHGEFVPKVSARVEKPRKSNGA
jgi:hypothetical protein